MTESGELSEVLDDSYLVLWYGVDATHMILLRRAGRLE